MNFCSVELLKQKKFLIFSHTEQLLGKPLEVETFNGDIKRQNGRGGEHANIDLDLKGRVENLNSVCVVQFQNCCK